MGMLRSSTATKSAVPPLCENTERKPMVSHLQIQPHEPQRGQSALAWFAFPRARFMTQTYLAHRVNVRAVIQKHLHDSRPVACSSRHCWGTTCLLDIRPPLRSTSMASQLGDAPAIVGYQRRLSPTHAACTSWLEPDVGAPAWTPIAIASCYARAPQLARPCTRQPTWATKKPNCTLTRSFTSVSAPRASKSLTTSSRPTKLAVPRGE